MDIKVDNNTAVVFDLDDTLYYEIDYLVSAYKAIAKRLHSAQKDLLFDIMIKKYQTGEDVFGYLSNEYQVSKEELLKQYRYHIPNIELNKGVYDVLVQIKEKGGKIAVLTDGRSITQRNKIQALGIGSFLDSISISEEIKAEKPNPLGFRRIQNQLNCASYWYIGDNLKKDFIAPNELNWSTIALLDSGKNIHKTDASTLSKNQPPQSYIRSFADLNIL